MCKNVPAFIFSLLFLNSEICENGQLRLVGGTDVDSMNRPLAGRVDYCYEEQWGTICNNGLDNFDARVLCREIGFSISELIKISYSF